MRKVQTIRFKITAIFLAMLILLQGCVVYHKMPTTLEQASQEQLTTKITTSDNETIKYKYITSEAGKFYGITTRFGEEVKNLLNEEEITTILTKNKKASTWATVAAIGTPVLAFGIAIIIGAGQVSAGYNPFPS